MNIFLAGAAGVIGRRLVPLLRDAGHAVTGTTRSPLAPSTRSPCSRMAATCSSQGSTAQTSLPASPSRRGMSIGRTRSAATRTSIGRAARARKPSISSWMDTARPDAAL